MTVLDDVEKTGTADPGVKSDGLHTDSGLGVLDTAADTQTAKIDAEYGRTVRGLEPRHVQLMAIGGSIGTGLFVGIGGVLSQAGPVSCVLGYIFWAFCFIYPCYTSVAEMVSYLPVRGSIFELTARFVDPALGFTLGWTYFYAGVMLVCTEYAAVATVMSFWLPDVNPAAWIAMSMVVCVFLNVVAVRWYGESEFFMSSLKVLLLFGLIFLTFITMLGGNPKHDRYGFRYWTDGRAFLEFYTDGDTGRFLGWWKVVLYAAFNIAGPDVITVSAGEIQNPRRTIPRVAKLIFWRIVGFYVIGVLAVGIICASDDPRLLGAIEDGSPGSAASPWVIGIQNLGIQGLPSLINALILSSGLSCGNAYLYTSSRTLYGLARDGQAPKFLLKCNGSGVPLYAVGVVSLISCITYLAASNNAVEVLFWFIDLTTTGLIGTYTIMLITWIGWDRARKAQGLADEALYYVARFNPWYSYLGLLVGCLALLFVGFTSFAPFSTQGFVTAYFCLPYMFTLFVGWKLIKRTKWVNPATADLVSGKSDCDRECAHWEEGGIQENWDRELAQMPVYQRIWEKMW